MTSEVRYVNTTPTAVDFKGSSPPIVVDRAAGKLYVLASGDTVTEIAGGGGGGAPTNATYIVQTANGTLTQERVATDTATVAWDFSFAGQARLNLVSSYAPTTRTISTTAPLSGGGDLSADRTLSVVTFSSVASGVVPASGGGTVNFLRADGTWAAPGGGGGATAYVDFGSAPNTRKTAVVTAASVSGSSQIMVTWGAALDTDDNDPEMDNVTFHAIPGSGQFTLVASSQSRIAGRMRVNYTVA